MPDPGDAPAAPAKPASQAALELRRIKAAAHAKLFGHAPGVQPQKIARYTVLQPLGVGGMGEVYLAYDDKLDRKVAIKLVRLDRDRGLERASTRLLREAQALAQLSHPNVVQVYETGSYEGRVFIAMEFVRGVHMRRWLEVAPRTWQQILDAYLQAGQGLAAAHRRGMVHRDFKPENVLVGDDGRVRVVDFGLVRSAPDPDPAGPEPVEHISVEDVERSSRLTQSGALMGTPSYMSPEQFQGLKATDKSDQFAFCVALYRGLYGWHPFASETRAELKRRVLSGQVAPPPRDARVPGGVFSVLVRGLHPDPEQRYPSMEALLAALAAPPRRRPAVFIGAGLAGLAALVLALLVPAPPRPCDDPADLLALAPGATLTQALASSPLPFARRVAERAGAQLDRYAADLARARAGVCAGSLASTHLRERHRACLDRRTRDLTVVTRAVARLRPEQFADAERLAESLPAIAPCFDPDNLAGPAAPPSELTAALDDARVSALAGQPGDAARQVDRIVKEADGDPLRAEAAALLGRVACARGNAQQGRDQLETALGLAISRRDDDLVADIGRHLAECTGDESVARLATAAAERLGDRERLTEIDLVRAELLAARGDPTSAEMLLRGTLARAEGRPATVVRIELLRGRMLALQGAHLEAAAHLDRALALLADLPRHPHLADALEERARLHLRQGDKNLARLRFGEALAIRTALPGQGPALARLHLALADLAAGAGQRSQAHRHYSEALTLAGRLPDALPRHDLVRAQTARDTATGRRPPGLTAPRPLTLP